MKTSDYAFEINYFHSHTMNTDNRIFLNHFVEKQAQPNKVTTCKYTWWNFIFIFLFEQYQKVANIFYLVNALCTQIPGAAVVPPVTTFFPIIFVLLVAAIREILEDTARAKADRLANTVEFTYIRKGVVAQAKSSQLLQGDIILIKNGQEVPSDCLLLASSEQSGIAFVNTASLDGESNLKPKVQIAQLRSTTLEEQLEHFRTMRSMVRAPPPTAQMDVFNGSLLQLDEQFVPISEYTGGDYSTQPSQNFTLQNVMLRGSRLQNTGHVFAAAVYSGQNCRVLQNNQKAKNKLSRLEGRLNMLMAIVIGLALALIVLMTILSIRQFNKNKLNPLFENEPTSIVIFTGQRFVQFFVITSTLIPISLFVTMEFSRFFQGLVIDSDKKLRNKAVRDFIDANPGKKLAADPVMSLMGPAQQSVQVKSSIAVENLSEVDIIFSDKTGTMTKNNMIYSSIVTQTGEISKELDPVSLFCLGLCHAVMPFEGDYQGESPDEIALVRAAAAYGLKLIQKNAAEYVFEFTTPAGKVALRYEVMVLIPFSSTRKKMSILLMETGVQSSSLSEELQKVSTHLGDLCYFTPQTITQPGQPFIITKGADSFMFPLCKAFKQQIVQEKIDELSTRGLRTLLFATKGSENAADLKQQWENIKQLSEDDERYTAYSRLLESDLDYACVSAVEDELQDDIFATLSILRRAGINLWMLTGDKTLTAINIAKTSGLSDPNCSVLDFSGDSTKTGYSRKSYLTNQLESAIQKQLELLTEQQMVVYKNELEQKQKLVDKTEGKLKQHIIKRPGGLTTTKTTLLIEGSVLQAIIEEQLHPMLFQIAFSAEAVVCCRLSPHEKAQIVKYSHVYFPHLTSLSIGDGANDVGMIKAAQIGIGVAGKEGMHACNSADISIPQFSFLKRLILVHGRLNHMRNSFIIDYSVYKNSVLVFCNLAYQIFCLQSAQIIAESFLVMMFNTLLTFFAIFVFSVVEKDVYEQFLEKNPKMRYFRGGSESNLQSLGQALLNAVWGAACIFGTHYCYYQNGSWHDEGPQTDIYGFQTSLTMCVVFVSVVRVLAQSNLWNWAVFSGVGLALFSQIATQVVGNYWTAFGIGQIGQLEFLYMCVGMPLLQIIAVSAAVIPDIVFRFSRRYLQPEEAEIIMAQQGIRSCNREF